MSRLLGSAAARAVYYLAIVPVGVFVRLFADPLRIKRAPEATNWRPLPPEESSLRRARKRS